MEEGVVSLLNRYVCVSYWHLLLMAPSAERAPSVMGLALDLDTWNEK